MSSQEDNAEVSFDIITNHYPPEERNEYQMKKHTKLLKVTETLPPYPVIGIILEDKSWDTEACISYKTFGSQIGF